VPRAKPWTPGLRIIGVLGLIVWAKRHGLVSDIATAISDLQNRANFRLSPDLVAQVLRDCENLS
jgi:predicted nucleic acid-binding protein